MTSSLTQQWLRQVAQPYPSRDRVYADVDAVLASYATLRPKTEVYTFNDGRTQLLICVHGLLPVTYRGTTYNIPVAIWITSDYPRDPPLAYVVPTSDMFVRASRAVDPSGRCEVDYLRDWQRKSEGCSLIGLVQALQDQFSREPPVYAKPRTAPVPAAPSATASSTSAFQPSRPPPPLPGSQSLPVTTVSTPAPLARPDDRPALPAKPHSHSPSPSLSSPRSNPPSLGARPPPPLPPAKPESAHTYEPPPVPRPPRAEPSSRPASAYASLPHVQDTRPNGYAGALPHAPPSHAGSAQASSPAIAGPSIQQPPYYTVAPIAPQTSGQSQQWQYPAAAPHVHWGYAPQSPPVYSTRPASVHVSTFNHPVPPAMSPPQSALHPQPVSAIPPPAVAPIPDLLDDDAPEPPPPSSVPAPPRPPNPELVRLHAAVHQKIHGELASLAAAANADAERMRATQADLLAGEPAIRDEMARLVAVRDVCRTVASRLRDTVNHAEANVTELRRKGDPEVDELICSTTIVHNQLINLVAEDNAIEDTIYHLHRALNAGRIDLDKFLKTTRVLAEEQFTKRVLIERILAGLPIGTSHSWT